MKHNNLCNKSIDLLNELSIILIQNNIDVIACLINTADKITQAFDASLCTIRILDENDKLKLLAAAGDMKDKIYRKTIEKGSDSIGSAITNKKIVIINNVEEIRLLLYRRSTILDNTIQSLAIMPIIVKNSVMGIITIFGNNIIGKDTEQLLSLLSNIISSIMEKNMVYEEMNSLYKSAIKSLVAAIEAKDIYTQGHSIRVSKYAVSIAERLGFSDNQIEEVEITGILHDIGKIGVSDILLTKPDRLDDNEFKVIKEHPVIGKRILEPIGFSENIIQGALLHHKRYDLKGYPFELELNELPIMSGIIGVADAYDAMTSIRTYRSPMEKTEALYELKKFSGTQFSPYIVEIVEQLYREGKM